MSSEPGVDHAAEAASLYAPPASDKDYTLGNGDEEEEDFEEQHSHQDGSGDGGGTDKDEKETHEPKVRFNCLLE
jgi:hypothetical protein